MDGSSSEISSLSTFFAQCSSSSSSTSKFKKKSKRWELITWNLGQIFEIKLWMVGQWHSRWMFAKQIAQKIFKSKIEACPVNAGHYDMPFKHHISFAINLAANFGCNLFSITHDIVSKLMHAAIWSLWAVLFESEQTPFPQTGHWFRPAALYRYQFGTCGFVPISYSYSETNYCQKDWAKQWALFWSATSSRQFHRSFHFT